MSLDPRIKNAGTLATEAFKYLGKLQKGEKDLLKTGNEFIDCHISGLLPSDCVLISANSGVGKTKLLYDTLDQILDEKVNKNASKIKVLEFSLEMAFLNKILRDTNKITSKKKSKILTEDFTKEEKELVKRYHDNLQDDRRFVCEETITTKEFYEMTHSFCSMYTDADSIVVCIDHVLLLKKEDKFEDPLEALTTHINQLRKEFKNVYFILLSQQNRGSMVVIKDKDNSMMPTTAMIYGSSHFEFLCSYIITLVDPFKYGVNQYMKVNPDRYDWLSEFYGDEDSKGKVSFETMGNMFIFVLKTRESDTPYKNLFIKPMDLTKEQKEKMKQSIDKKEDDIFTTPSFQVPIFEKETPIEPNFDLKGAFDDTDNPF